MYGLFFIRVVRLAFDLKTQRVLRRFPGFFSLQGNWEGPRDEKKVFSLLFYR